MEDLRLDQALGFHREGQTKKAIRIYEELLQTDHPPLHAFLNASAIWRNSEKLSEAIACLERGTELYPKEPGPWNNLGNCHMDRGQFAKAIVAYRRSLSIEQSFTDARVSLASCLRELGHFHLAYATLETRFQKPNNENERHKLLVPLIETLLALSNKSDKLHSQLNLQNLVSEVETELRSQLADTDPSKAGIVMTQIWIQLDELDRALSSRAQLRTDTKEFLTKNPNLKIKGKFWSTWNALSWHLAIKLLKKGRLQEGWSLYEYGLQVSAEGPQRWQRSLKKPFTPAEVPFWRGEPLAGRHLLLLGEQGIGDAMMFTTLLPRLQKEGAKISLLPGDRLISIYKRSLPDVQVLSLNDLRKGNIRAQDFDLQSPLGSICQYRFTELSQYGPRSPFLRADPGQVSKIRSRYKDGRPLIGISWQGGGKANRIPLKSIGLTELAPFLSRDDCRFVSLQYGDDGPHLERFRKSSGIDVLHDDGIDALKDMDGWLSQVAAMDAVISIANTTIHGAGGLGIPTLCLVSRQSDWRWIEPSIYQGCYWYPSVQAAYQSDQGEWEPALQDAKSWLDNQLSS